MKKNKMYSSSDYQRFYKEETYDRKNVTPSDGFNEDLSRIIHSHGFRRLCGKTQLFPKSESDFFRNRLTHSLEVAQIAKTIARNLNADLDEELHIDSDIVEMAGLAHDLGHPPFGHQGEEILAECMLEYGGFEGNAQTLHLLCRLEKKVHAGELNLGGFNRQSVDRRGGLNLTYRSLASILKYDNDISEQIKFDNGKSGKTVYKGYYTTEKQLVKKIKEKVLGNYHLSGPFKTIECQIMDLADDIAYSTFDLEDAFKAKFISPIGILNQNEKFYSEIAEEVEKNAGNRVGVPLTTSVTAKMVKDVLSDLFKFMFDLPDDLIQGVNELSTDEFSMEEYMFLGNQYTTKYNEMIIDDGYVRADLMTQLIQKSIQDIYIDLNEDCPALSVLKIKELSMIRIETLKQIAFKTQILSPRLKANEYRGKRIVGKIFESLRPQNIKQIPELLPDDFKIIYIQRPGDIIHQYRVISDFLACMTDEYASEFYNRLTSSQAIGLFKPYQ